MTRYETITAIFAGIQALGVLIAGYAIWQQLKQFNFNVKDTAASRHLEDYIELTKILLEKPGLLYARKPELMGSDENDIQFYLYSGIAVGYLERVWHDWQKELIDETAWRTWMDWFNESWFQNETFREFWESEGKYFQPDFIKAVTNDHKKFTKRKKESTEAEKSRPAESVRDPLEG